MCTEMQFHGQVLAILAITVGVIFVQQAQMVMTDPIADMLTRIRNANTVRHEKLEAK